MQIDTVSALALPTYPKNERHIWMFPNAKYTYYLANYVLRSKVGIVKGLWSLEYQISVEQSLLINPTVSQLLHSYSGI